MRPDPVRTAALTLGTLVAFAANSVLCRLALAPGDIDAVRFTALRLASGAVALLVLLAARAPGEPRLGRGSLASAAMLFAYAAPFSLAYVRLPAGTGALILFGAVQATMIGWALRSGERPGAPEWAGLALALGGLVYLVLPGLSAPPLGAALWMLLAGMAWGVYSLRGRGSAHPLADTAGNFARAALAGIALAALTTGATRITARGAALAVLSGAVASGLGYVTWYAALRGLTATRAALVQLAVPVLAALGGVLLLGERVTWRLVLAAVLILGGVAIAIAGRVRWAPAAAGAGTGGPGSA